MRACVLAAIGLLVIPLAGCGATTSACVDWVDFATPADAAKDATLVVVGTVVGDAGSRTIYGAYAPVHRFAVESVIAGTLPLGTSEIEVAAVPETCNGDRGSFPDGDPLATTQRVELFLIREDGGLRLLTPYDGLVVAPVGEPLPWVPEVASP